MIKSSKTPILIGDDIDYFQQPLENNSRVIFSSTYLTRGSDLSSGIYNVLDSGEKNEKVLSVPAREFRIFTIDRHLLPEFKSGVVVGQSRFEYQFNMGYFFFPPTSKKIWSRWLREGREEYTGSDYLRIPPLFTERERLCRATVLRIDLTGGDVVDVRCDGLVIYQNYLLAYHNAFDANGEELCLPLLAVPTGSFVGVYGVEKNRLRIPSISDDLADFYDGENNVVDSEGGENSPLNYHSLEDFYVGAVPQDRQYIFVGENIIAEVLKTSAGVDIYVSNLPKLTGVEEITSYDTIFSEPLNFSMNKHFYEMSFIPFDSIETGARDTQDIAEWFKSAFNSGMYTVKPYSTAMWNEWLRSSEYGGSSGSDSFFTKFYIDKNELRKNIIRNRVDIRGGVSFRVRCHGVVMFGGFAVAYINGFSNGEPLSLPVAAVRGEDFVGLSTVPKEELKIPVL